MLLLGVSDIRWEKFLQDGEVIFEVNCLELIPQVKLCNRKWTEKLAAIGLLILLPL